MNDAVALSTVAAATGGKLHGPDRPVQRLCIDTRQPFTPENTLFIALRGKHHDGHAHVAEMQRRGVRCFLLRKGSAPMSPEDSVVEVDDTLKALQDLAAWHRGLLRAPVVGITGSNGKTVVKEWLAQLLQPDMRVGRSPGSWNSQVGVPLGIWALAPEHEFALVEAGISQPGEMAALERIIRPDIGIFTNIGPAHGANFPDDAAKAAEKAILFRSAKAVVYPRDQAVVHHALQALHGAELLGWGRHPDAALRITDQHTGLHGTRIDLLWRNKACTVELPFTDEASVENALHCTALMLHLGSAPETIAERLRGLHAVSMRLHLIPGLNNGTLLDDAYSNDLASLTIALGQLARTAGGRPRTVVLSDIAQSSIPAAKLYATVADLLRDAKVDQLVAVGPELQALARLFPDPTLYFPNADHLLRTLPEPPVNGAVTLVKGARGFGLERVVRRWEQHTHGTVLETDLEAMRHNLNHYRELCGPQVRIMAMVKANGYGGGAAELSRFLEHEQVAWLGVAYADEGIELRRQGIRTPVLVMNPEPVALETLHRHRLQTEVYDLRSLQAALDFAEQVPEALPVHLKLDTGMHRLGFMPDEMPALLDALRGTRQLRVASILSHLAASEDPRQDAFTQQQIALFRTMAGRIREVLDHAPLLHIANSAGATRFPGARLDMVRLGIGLHGIGADAAETAHLRPVETLRTVIAQLKTVPAGDSIGYGRKDMAVSPLRIAVLPIGYADGLNRRLGEGRGRVWIHGHEARTVGTICMDMCMVDVTGIPCREGDDATIFSPQHPLQQFAHDLGTIPYEALTAISPRVKRVFVQGS